VLKKKLGHTSGKVQEKCGGLARGPKLLDAARSQSRKKGRTYQRNGERKKTPITKNVPGGNDQDGFVLSD